MYFDDLTFTKNSDIFMGKSININDEGFIYGNMFKDEYKPYKNYSVYKLKGKTDRENLLLKIMEENFIVTDLGLYLDINPKDLDIYKCFKDHETKLREYIDMYENKYESITLNAKKDNYTWENGPWPWEVDK